MAVWRRDTPSLYERTEWDGLGRQPDVALKNALIRALMPEDTSSVLDVGCGNGLLVNSLPMEWRVVGVDRSERALETVTRDKQVASVESLPFAVDSFDVVVCSEVLEHLPDDVLAKAVSELARVCRGRLILSVPNDEDLWLASTRCDNCGIVFNRHGHLRSFDRLSLQELIIGWDALALLECGETVSLLPSWMTWIRARWGKSTTRSEKGDICPSCGARSVPGRETLIERVHRRMHYSALAAKRTKMYWLILAAQKQG